MELTLSQIDKLVTSQFKQKDKDQHDRMVNYLTSIGFEILGGASCLNYNPNQYIGFYNHVSTEKKAIFNEVKKDDFVRSDGTVYSQYELIPMLFMLRELLNIPIKIKVAGCHTLRDSNVKSLFNIHEGYGLYSDCYYYIFDNVLEGYSNRSTYADKNLSDYIELTEEELKEYINYLKTNNIGKLMKKQTSPEFVTLSEELVAQAYYAMDSTQKQALLHYFNPITRQFPYSILKNLVDGTFAVNICSDWKNKIREEIIDLYEPDDMAISRQMVKSFEDCNTDFLDVRTSGEYDKQGLWLSGEYDWSIVTDSSGSNVLICKSKK